MAGIFKLLKTDRESLTRSEIQIDYFDLVTETRKTHSDEIIYMTSRENGLTVIHMVNSDIVLDNFSGILVFQKIREAIPNLNEELRGPKTRRIIELRISGDVYHPNPDLELYYFLKTTNIVGQRIAFFINSFMGGFEDEVSNVESMVIPNEKEAVRVTLKNWGELIIYDSGKVSFYKRFYGKMDYATEFFFNKVNLADKTFYLRFNHIRIVNDITNFNTIHERICCEAMEKYCITKDTPEYQEFIGNLFASDNIETTYGKDEEGDEFISIFFHREVLRVSFFTKLTDNIMEGLKLMNPLHVESALTKD